MTDIDRFGVMQELFEKIRGWLNVTDESGEQRRNQELFWCLRDLQEEVGAFLKAVKARPGVDPRKENV